MSAQIDLFAHRVPVIDTPAARRTDPLPSHLAAAEITANGVRGNQQRQVLAAVRAWPGRTSRELAQLMCGDRHAVARRLPELESEGKVHKDIERTCTIGHRLASTWLLGPKPTEAIAA